MSSYKYIWRVTIIVMVATIAFGGLVSRLAYLHLGEHESVDQKIEKMYMHERPISVGRGRILDRNGSVLAIDLPACDVMINPRQIKAEKSEMDVATKLASALNRPVDELYLKIKQSDRLGLRIERFASAEAKNELADMDRQCVWTTDVSIRNYPQDQLLCHVLGFMNWQRQPGGGVEQNFNNRLKGRDGLWVGKRDGRRHELYDRRHLQIAPMHGSDVVLTIDQNLQSMLEESIDEMMEEQNPEAAWGIMQNVRTGEILAMASRPAFDPNEFRFSGKEERRNRAISYLYEPGSTFKPIVVASALNEGIVNPEDVIFCENGSWGYGGRILHDDHSLGELTVSDIVKKSSNIGAAKIALKLGDKRLWKYLRSFGFGSLTKTELPGEEAGILRSPDSWSKISPTRLAMGHEVAVSSLQLIDAISAIANGGYLMRPTIVKKIVDPEGNTVYESRPEVLRRVIGPEASRQMRWMMATVTQEGGTGRRARVPGYIVGGKTGTAQKPIPGGYSSSMNIASFVGFLPVDRPEIAIIIVADNPQPLHFGGLVAAPAFKRVAEQAVRYLNIPPSDKTKYANLKSSHEIAELGTTL